MRLSCTLAGRLIASIAWTTSLQSAETLQALLVAGYDKHGHPWQQTTPILTRLLTNSMRFTVEVAMVSPQNAASFKPDFAKYQAVVLYTHGAAWPAETYKALETYLAAGGGLVVIHNAVGAFEDWNEYRRMIGIGPGDRQSGVRLKFDEGKDQLLRMKPGEDWPSNGHGRQHEFVVKIRQPDHAITVGLPREWKHTNDELYHGLRGPAENMEVLATDYSAPETGGTGEHEPAVMTIRYGKGRVFHTTMGHDAVSMSCAGFQTIVLRGTEWAATGEITSVRLPDDFPTAAKSSSRNLAGLRAPN
ncbi:MAG: ThuA domain-containing protein [Verrucomicrobia bacterium]|nr:ThuA domain-containing protein [Verrucomicrobiota bacterium]